MQVFLLVKEPMKRLLVAGLVLASLFLAVPTVHADNSPMLTALAATYKLITPDYSCTSTAIKTDGKVTYFLTARHCTVQVSMAGEVPNSVEKGIAVFQPGQEPRAVEMLFRGQDRNHDWAILVGQFAVPATIPLSSSAPFYGEAILVSGYPFGLGPIVVRGAVSGLDVHASPDVPQQMFAINVSADPGNSGSAVIDEATMTIIGILDAAAVDGQGDPPIIFADPVSDLSPEALAKVGN